MALLLISSSHEVAAQTLNWSADVGSVSAAGSSSYVVGSGTYQLTGTGTGVGGSADAFHFAYYQAVCGDGQMVVRLTSADPSAQAALVLRTSLAADASSAAVLAGNGGARFVRRLAAGDADSVVGAAATASPPCWLKLVRSGGTVSGAVSMDGQTWTGLGSDTLALGTATIYVGLAVSNGSASDATGASASFDGLSSDFLPADGLLLWLKADAGVSADPTTHAVSSWADQSGHGNDALQPGASGQPLWVDGVLTACPFCTSMAIAIHSPRFPRS